MNGKDCFSGVGTHGLILFPSGGLGSCRPVLRVPGIVQEGVMRGPVEVARLERYSGGRSGTYLSARVITYIFDILFCEIKLGFSMCR
jgi:hypothetical protein